MEKTLNQLLVLFRQGNGYTRQQGTCTLYRDGKYGYFKDLDYYDQTVGGWSASFHLSRLYEIYLSRYSESQDVFEDKSFLDDYISALDFWLDNDFQNPNWWRMEIGIPGQLAKLCLLLGDRLSPDRRQKACEIVSRSSVSHNSRALKWTGANLLWAVRCTIYYAMLSGEKALIKPCTTRLAEEIVIAEGSNEGIKPDFSFYQHGPQLYSCGYGRSFTLELSQLVYILSGTEYTLPPDKLELFQSFVLEGQRYFVHGRSIDYLAAGREISRENCMSSESFLDALWCMLKSEGYSRKAELREFYDAIITNKDNFSGTKYFPSSYFLSHKTGSRHYSVKGCHSKFRGTEWGCGGENRLGYLHGCGANTCYLSDGLEYHNIAPFWKYDSLPGVTSKDFTDEELYAITNKDYDASSIDNFREECSGASKEGSGILRMRLERDGITGYLTFIAWEKGMICLGCDINAPFRTHTTVDQCLLRGKENLKDLAIYKEQFIENGGFRYTNLSNNLPMIVNAGEVEGSWKRNSLSKPDIKIFGRILTVRFEHKSGVSSYAYAVTASGNAPDDIDTIFNTPEKQGVRFKDG
ncbi:MAG: hypothetical protein GX633_04085, partial [Clostridiales bacterium]|nr:hypothetical protein [Clostridiales bacterium]